MRFPTTQEREDRYLILELVDVSVTRVTCVAGGIYRAPLLHSMDPFVKLSLNLGPWFFSYLSAGVREGTSRKETWDRGWFGVCLGCIAARRIGTSQKALSLCDSSSTTGYSM